MGVVAGLAQLLGFRPPFSGCGRPSRVQGLVPLTQHHLSGELCVSCQHKTDFYRLSWLNKAMPGVLGENLSGSGSLSEGSGGPWGDKSYVLARSWLGRTPERLGIMRNHLVYSHFITGGRDLDWSFHWNVTS